MADSQKAILKVVARLRDGKLVKGYLADPAPSNFENLVKEAPYSFPTEIVLRPAESTETISVPLESLKALFFVKTFEGRKEYKEVKFFDKNPPIKGLWVRVEFSDHESLEGVVQNSIHYLVHPGFFLKPPDPQSNNAILYVVKSSLVDFRVLGVRMNY